MAESALPQWFGVRCVYLHAGGLFEERVITVIADDLDDAVRRGEIEGAEYVADIEITRLEFVQAFMMFDQPGDGAEVFSLVRQSDLDPEKYLTRFFDTGTERQQHFGAD